MAIYLEVKEGSYFDIPLRALQSENIRNLDGIVNIEHIQRVLKKQGAWCRIGKCANAKWRLRMTLEEVRNMWLLQRQKTVLMCLCRTGRMRLF